MSHFKLQITNATTPRGIELYSKTESEDYQSYSHAQFLPSYQPYTTRQPLPSYQFNAALLLRISVSFTIFLSLCLSIRLTLSAMNLTPLIDLYDPFLDGSYGTATNPAIPGKCQTTVEDESVEDFQAPDARHFEEFELFTGPTSRQYQAKVGDKLEEYFGPDIGNSEELEEAEPQTRPISRKHQATVGDDPEEEPGFGDEDDDNSDGENLDPYTQYPNMRISPQEIHPPEYDGLRADEIYQKEMGMKYGSRLFVLSKVIEFPSVKYW